MEPTLDWLHDDMVNAMADVCNGGMGRGGDGARRPDVQRFTAARYSKGLHPSCYARFRVRGRLGRGAADLFVRLPRKRRREHPHITVVVDERTRRMGR